MKCLCGCGKEVKTKGCKFAWGHYAKIKNPSHRKDVIKKIVQTKKKNGSYKKHSEFMMGNNNPMRKYPGLLKGNKNGMYGKRHSDKTKKKISKSLSGEKHPLYGKFGKEHPSWVDGKGSVEPYCEIWLDKDYKESIKERDNYKCKNPYCWNTVIDICLHHINYNKKDCAPKNLITLCFSCNSRANSKRKYWERFYKRINTY